MPLEDILYKAIVKYPEEDSPRRVQISVDDLEKFKKDAMSRRAAFSIPVTDEYWRPGFSKILSLSAYGAERELMDKAARERRSDIDIGDSIKRMDVLSFSLSNPMARDSTRRESSDDSSAEGEEASRSAAAAYRANAHRMSAVSEPAPVSEPVAEPPPRVRPSMEVPQAGQARDEIERPPPFSRSERAALWGGTMEARKTPEQDFIMALHRLNSGRDDAKKVTESKFAKAGAKVFGLYEHLTTRLKVSHEDALGALSHTIASLGKDGHLNERQMEILLSKPQNWAKKIEDGVNVSFGRYETDDGESFSVELRKAPGGSAAEKWEFLLGR
jgi:hypothetical protein